MKGPPGHLNRLLKNSFPVILNDVRGNGVEEGTYHNAATA
jgi:hypothetical protein